MTMRRMAIHLGLLACMLGAPVRANDWPFWRGPEQSGATRENAPVTDWSPTGKNLLWKNDIGGRTTPIVMNGRVFSIGPVGSGENLQERVVCVDAESGKVIWEYRFNVFHTDMVENRVGWTALVGDPETGNVYAHGTGGEFFCFDRDGQLLWKRSLTEEFGRISGYGGRLQTPFIDEDKVFISFLNSSWGDQAKPTHRFLAMDKKSGEVVYWAAPGGDPLDNTYASPVVTVIDGRRMLIAPTGDGCAYGMLARTGEKVWGYKLSKRGLNVSAVVEGNRAYICHSEENYTTSQMGAIVCLDASKRGDIGDGEELWRRDGYTVGYASPVIHNGRLYVVTNEADLVCFDAKTGQEIWNYDLGRVGKGSPVITADNVIYVGEQTGVFHILKDEGDKCTSLCRYEFPMGEFGVDEFYGSPAIANGRVYFQVRSGMYCLGSKESGSGSVPVASAGNDDASATYLVPADVTIASGQRQEFRLETQPPTGSHRETITLNAAGVVGQVEGSAFIAGAGFSAGTLKAEFAGTAPSARVRVLPPLPLEVNFDDFKPGTVPPGWVGCGRKVTIADQDGNKVLRKLADKKFPSPPFMRFMGFVTMPIAAGYTVECDMSSQAKKGRLKPDMGLVNARYQLTAMGMSKMLRVDTWSAQPRLRVEVPFEYEADKWYTMKFTVRLEGDQARLLGKVWPRDEQEPDGWMIDTVDPCPNREGSAGLYAYSNGTTPKSDGPETFFDNLKVYREAD